MTTIAANHQMMACDSKVVDGGIVTSVKTKIYKINGDIIGFAGSLSEGMAFVAWYKDQEKDKPPIDDTSILLLRSDGLYTMESNFTLLPETTYGFYAIGSGSHIAMGAMMAGADPYEAVKIAAKLDNDSGGRVRKLSL